MVNTLTMEIADLKSQKNFGLTWEDKPDAQVVRVKDEAPMLLEDRSKAVVTKDNSQNHILINGDNFHALTALRASHMGKVDVIYIDPPYNTGNKDFIYNDNYLDKEDGYRHSKWLSFMEKRIRIAKELLRETGVIFVSIDDNEQARLKLLMDEIFGSDNFISMFSWVKTSTASNLSKKVKKNVEYILAYAQNANNVSLAVPHSRNGSETSALLNPPNPLQMVEFPARSVTFYDKSMVLNQGTYGKVELLDDIIVEEFTNMQPFKMSGNFKWSSEKIREEHAAGTKIFIKSKLLAPRYRRTFHSGTMAPSNLISNKQGVETNDQAGQELSKILGNTNFSYPKPVSLIKFLVSSINKIDAVVLDFFAGSGTTAHAIAELNKEDGGTRQCILITDGGKTETRGESSKNTKEDPVNIAEEITYERVKRVLTGRDWADGEDHEPLGGNLHYFKVEMIKIAGLTKFDQKTLFEKYIPGYTALSENVFIRVASKDEMNEETFDFKKYEVLTNSEKSKYTVAIETHDYALDEVKEFLEPLKDTVEIVISGNDVSNIPWVMSNPTRYRIEDPMNKAIESRKFVQQSII